MDSKSFRSAKKEEFSIQLPEPSTPHTDSSRSSDLRFVRLQPSDDDLVEQRRLEFGNFVAREAVIDEEYWVDQ